MKIKKTAPSFERKNPFLSPCTLILFVGLMILNPLSVWAADCEPWLAKLVSIEGEVKARKAGEESWQTVKVNKTFCRGEALQVGKNSRAAALLSDHSLVRLDAQSLLTFTGERQQQGFWVELLKGIGHFISRVPRSLNISTPFVNASVEGTEFLVRVGTDTAFLSVFEGAVTAQNKHGSLKLTSGESATVGAGQAPIIQQVIRPRENVQWALYYPAILQFDRKTFAGQPAGAWQSRAAQSISLFTEGAIPQALDALSEIGKKIDDARFFNYRASLRLAVGQVAGAQSDLDQSLALTPNDGDALALKAVIAVVQNDREGALALSEQALTAAPNSVGPLLARSYALQSNFQLAKAREALESAVAQEPENALAWSRLSELRLMFRDLKAALTAAEKAVAINPNVVRAQTVLGFAQLMQIDTEAAKQSFEKAMRLDQASPLVRLGLGLTLIREGNLKAGRKEIEIAAMLDPSNALIRSYLGKAYYEEKREDLADEQYRMARELDANDPTPDLYSAILNQTRNRPVEALKEIERSIALNKNRAVYRSRLLLDEDLAARSVSLARIYDDLGFQQLALVEAWNSLNSDPANYSAHRFLADSYKALPRSEIAKNSALLMAQLLQPLNINPVQPGLSDIDTAILSGTGLRDPSFNELDQLFNRDRFHFLSSGVWGENGLFGEEAILSGLHGRSSYSFGQSYQESDGFRANNGFTQKNITAFAQMRLTARTSIQAEFRRSETEKGDLNLNFDPDDFSKFSKKKREVETYRLGFHQILSPRSNIIATFFYRDSKEDGLSELLPDPPFITGGSIRALLEARGYSGEIQHLFVREHTNIITGLGHFDGDSIPNIIANILSPIPALAGEKIIDDKKTRDRHTNLYLYSITNVFPNTTLTLGGSGDFFDGIPRNRDQFNPKLGLTLRPKPSTSLRIAAFRTLKRLLVANQTIEPTQVAGFQQFFDDTNGTDAWRFGAAVDQEFSKTLFGGIEVTTRDVEVPQVPSPGLPSEVKRDERRGRAYLYWAPHPQLSASAEYLYERLDSEDFTNPFNPKVKTQRFPLGINYYLPNGFFTRIKGTFIDQEGMFKDVASGKFLDDGDRFWLVDASVGYRLPKRLGFLTLAVKNLLDEKFRFQETDLGNPSIQAERLVFSKLTLAF